MLNRQFTFTRFVAGNNQFAPSAAQAVTQNPGQTANPLFLHGGIGLGKTHLLHAIGHQKAAECGPVAYATVEMFTHEFIAALQKKTVAQFRQRYDETRLLLLDEVQNLAGKGRIQAEVLRRFESLHTAGRPVVLACDRPAREIRGGLGRRLIDLCIIE